jgi:hypothetical protein
MLRQNDFQHKPKKWGIYGEIVRMRVLLAYTLLRILLALSPST